MRNVTRARSAGGTDGPSLAIFIHYWLCLRWAASWAGSADGRSQRLWQEATACAQLSCLPLPWRPQPLGVPGAPARPGEASVQLPLSRGLGVVVRAAHRAPRTRPAGRCTGRNTQGPGTPLGERPLEALPDPRCGAQPPLGVSGSLCPLGLGGPGARRPEAAAKAGAWGWSAEATAFLRSADPADPWGPLRFWVPRPQPSTVPTGQDAG